MTEEVESTADKIMEDTGFNSLGRELKILALAVPMLKLRGDAASDIFHSFLGQLLDRSIDAEINPKEMMVYGFAQYVDDMYCILATVNPEKEVEIFMRFMFEMSLSKAKNNFSANGDDYKKAAEAAKAAEGE